MDGRWHTENIIKYLSIMKVTLRRDQEVSGRVILKNLGTGENLINLIISVSYCIRSFGYKFFSDFVIFSFWLFDLEDKLYLWLPERNLESVYNKPEPVIIKIKPKPIEVGLPFAIPVVVLLSVSLTE